MTISFKHEYRRHTLTSRCDVISDVMNIKNTFYVIMCDVLSISYVKMNLSQYFEIFKIAAILRFRCVIEPEVVFQNLTYFLILWPDYICGPSLVMIGQKLPPVSQKMWQFHLNMNIEGTLWRHAVTSLVTSSLWKSFWWMIYILSFYTCCQIEAILKTAKFLKLTKIWGPGELFHHKCHRKYVILTG